MIGLAEDGTGEASSSIRQVAAQDPSPHRSISGVPVGVATT